MKVLYIASIGEDGGATKSLLKLVSLIKVKGVDVTIVTPKKNGIVMNYCKDNNIDFIYLKSYKMSYSLVNLKYKNVIKTLAVPFYSLYTYIGNIIAANKISKLINISEYDIVHTNLTRDELGIMISKKYKIPHIVHLREYGDLDFNCRYMRPNYYQYLNKNTTMFIAISNSIKNYYINKGLDPKKITVIYNGVSIDKRNKTVNCNNTDNIKIVISSNISLEKGQIQVIKALHQLNNPLIHLYLYGSGDNIYIDKLKKEINQLGLLNNIHFLGYVNNLEEELSKYDIAITPSKSEAFGRVTIEYMLSKLPVIASNTGANGEIIINNESGLIYSYGDIVDLSKQIKKLVDSKKLRNRLAEQGYLRATKYFLAEINAQNIYNLYKKINN